LKHGAQRMSPRKYASAVSIHTFNDLRGETASLLAMLLTLRRELSRRKGGVHQYP
jgi:hypothetical protein